MAPLATGGVDRSRRPLPVQTLDGRGVFHAPPSGPKRLVRPLGSAATPSEPLRRGVARSPVLVYPGDASCGTHLGFGAVHRLPAGGPPGRAHACQFLTVPAAPSGPARSATRSPRRQRHHHRVRQERPYHHPNQRRAGHHPEPRHRRSGPEATISGNDDSRVFDIQSGKVTIAGLTIAHGRADGNSPGPASTGGGVLNSGNLTLENDVLLITRPSAIPRSARPTAATAAPMAVLSRISVR